MPIHHGQQYQQYQFQNYHNCPYQLIRAKVIWAKKEKENRIVQQSEARYGNAGNSIWLARCPCRPNVGSQRCGELSPTEAFTGYRGGL